MSISTGPTVGGQGVGSGVGASITPAMSDHLAWLAQQHQDLVDHRRSSGVEEPELDAADGDEQLVFRSGGDNQVYRSLNSFESLGFEESEELNMDPPVYRSLTAEAVGAHAAQPAPALASVDDVDAAWLQGPRPPLLKRQRARSDLYSPASAAVYTQELGL